MVRIEAARNLLWLAALIGGCGESRRAPAMVPVGGCNGQAGCADIGGIASKAGCTNTGGIAGEADCTNTGGIANEAGGGGAAGRCAGGVPSTPAADAAWPMPNPASSGLPNPMSYDTSRADAVLDTVTGLTWQSSVTDATFTSTDAARYCVDLRAGGYCDWRLPSRIELVSLVDFTRGDTALDASSFPDTEGDFLTASILKGYRWRIGADGGTRVLMESLATASRVRCVRAEDRPLPDPRYTFAGQSPDDTATDHGTGLVWQRRPSTTTFSFTDAQTHCANLSLGGAGGFRVPSMKELQTVLDEQAPNYVDPEVFPDFPTQANPTFWTSTPSARGPSDAWFVRGGSTLDVAIDAGVKAKFYVRCVK